MTEKVELKSYTVVEILVTFISLGWAVVMLLNPDTFDRSDNFSVMEKIVNKEWVVGIVCLVLVSIKGTGMLIRNRRLRWIGLMSSAVFWTLVSATFLMSTSGIDLNTGFVVYSAISVMCLWTAKEVLSSDGAV